MLYPNLNELPHIPKPSRGQLPEYFNNVFYMHCKYMYWNVCGDHTAFNPNELFDDALNEMDHTNNWNAYIAEYNFWRRTIWIMFLAPMIFSLIVFIFFSLFWE